MTFPAAIHVDVQTLVKEAVNGQKQTVAPFTPFYDVAIADASTYLRGYQAIQEGRVGCVVVAGGQGTRLHFSGPKGCFPVTAVKKKSLFQLLAEKVSAASGQAARTLPLAVMTSHANHEDTVAFFRDNAFFGLVPEQVSFFCQGDLPLLDDDGNGFMEDKEVPAVGPDGNGTALYHFVKSGVYDKWRKNGIDVVTFILIDNALADPYDAILVGHHLRDGADLTIKCIARERVDENLGVLVRRKDGVAVVEYTEMSPDEKVARDPDGAFRHRWANISLFAMNMAFIHNAAQHVDDMPWHVARKSATKYDKTSQKIMAWKCEKFIFDAFPYAKKVGAVAFPREGCFAPLKNAEGPDSIATVQEQLQAYDKAVLEAITGLPAPQPPFELHPAFYYPTKVLRGKWRDRSPTTAYIVP